MTKKEQLLKDIETVKRENKVSCFEAMEMILAAKRQRFIDEIENKVFKNEK